MNGSATFGPEGETSPYRYALGRLFPSLLRTGGRRVGFIMLNPSTATGELDDPTIRRCIGFAKDWDFGGLIVGNIFALRSTDPRALYAAADPVGPENDWYLRSIAERCELVVCAWGNHGRLNGRGAAVLKLLREAGAKPHALGMTNAGQPAHPLYLPKMLAPVPMRPA